MLFSTTKADLRATGEPACLWSQLLRRVAHVYHLPSTTLLPGSVGFLVLLKRFVFDRSCRWARAYIRRRLAWPYNRSSRRGQRRGQQEARRMSVCVRQSSSSSTSVSAQRTDHEVRRCERGHGRILSRIPRENAITGRWVCLLQSVHLHVLWYY